MKWNVNLADWGHEEQKEGWVHSGRVPILYGMQRSTGCVGKKQKAKHLPLFKSLRKGSGPLPDRWENPRSCGREGREGGRAWSQLFLFLSFTLSLSQAHVCVGRVRRAFSELAFGRVKGKVRIWILVAVFSPVPLNYWKSIGRFQFFI